MSYIIHYFQTVHCLTIYGPILHYTTSTIIPNTSTQNFACQQRTVLYPTAQCSMLPQSSTQHCTVLHSATQHYKTPCYSLLPNTVYPTLQCTLLAKTTAHFPTDTLKPNTLYSSILLPNTLLTNALGRNTPLPKTYVTLLLNTPLTRTILPNTLQPNNPTALPYTLLPIPLYSTHTYSTLY